MNVLIIEDEKKSAARLVSLLQNIDNSIEIVGIIPSIEYGVEWFANNPSPELIFSDIELGDGVSFELFQKVGISSPIIFCTVYDQYMVKAFETNAVSYIQKPYSREQIQNSLKKYHSMIAAFSVAPYRENNNIEQILNVLENTDVKNYKSTLIVNDGDNFFPVVVDEIAFIYATSGGMQLFTYENKKYAYNSTLDDLIQVLNPKSFFHANRQFIINRKVVQTVERNINQKLTLKLYIATPEIIVISRLKAKAFLDWIEH